MAVRARVRRRPAAVVKVAIWSTPCPRMWFAEDLRLSTRRIPRSPSAPPLWQLTGRAADELAVADPRGRSRWGELDERTTAFGHGLESLGLAPGDHVALVAEQRELRGRSAGRAACRDDRHPSQDGLDRRRSGVSPHRRPLTRGGHRCRFGTRRRRLGGPSGDRPRRRLRRLARMASRARRCRSTGGAGDSRTRPAQPAAPRVSCVPTSEANRSATRSRERRASPAPCASRRTRRTSWCPACSTARLSPSRSRRSPPVRG